MRAWIILGVNSLFLACGAPDGTAETVEARAVGEGAFVTTLTSTRFNMIGGDPAAGLWLAVGGTAEQFRALCGGGNPGAFGPFQVHLIAQPAEGRLSTVKVTGEDVPTVLWRMSVPMTWSEDFARVDALFCADVGTTPIAAGLSTGFLRDNLGAVREQWAWLGRGVLSRPDGSPLFFNHSGACMFPDPQDPGDVRCESRLELH